VVPAAVEFVDIAGLVRGASEGEGLGNQFLSHIREVDAIAQVVRIFDDTNITHVHGSVNPIDDIGVINLELILADQETVSKRLNNIERDVKRGDKDALFEQATLSKVKSVLESGELAHKTPLTAEEQAVVRSIHLLSMKPILYVLNKKAGGYNFDEQRDPRFDQLISFFESRNDRYVIVDAAVEHELSQVAADDRDMFRREFGVVDDGINDLIKGGYAMLGLITFLTTGPEESRAWTIVRGSTAPVAGAAIHTDFKDKFIRADVIAWDDLLRVGSYAKAREQGLVRTEGKEYVVQDGDVIEFKV
jgi:ribosome-binding ATPase